MTEVLNMLSSNTQAPLNYQTLRNELQQNSLAIQVIMINNSWAKKREKHLLSFFLEDDFLVASLSSAAFFSSSVSSPKRSRSSSSAAAASCWKENESASEIDWEVDIRNLLAAISTFQPDKS